MITHVEATNARGSVLELPLEDVLNGFVVEEIEGLDPVKATIVTSSFAQQDGVQYQSSRRDQRDIKLTIGLEPDYTVNTVKGLRSQLYRHFMPKSEVKLTFIDDSGLAVDISGRVETCEAPLFTEEPQMDVVVICFDPDFVEETPVVINGNTTAAETEMLVDYDGTVETGVEFTLNANRAVPSFVIYHRLPNGDSRTLTFNYALASGQALTIVTTPGSKSATIAGTSVLYGMTPDSNWISLEPGDNFIRVYAEGAPVPFTLKFTNKYGGL